MLMNIEDVGMISILKIATSRLTSGDFSPLKSALFQALSKGHSSLLVDMSGVRSIARSGMAALVEFQSEAPRELRVGFFGACAAVGRDIQKSPFSVLFSFYETREAALNAPDFRDRRLTGTKAVVLCAGIGSRMSPLSFAMPKPMLDFLGKPVLERLLDHLGGFGIRDIVLNPGHLGFQIHAHFRRLTRRNIQFLNEGRQGASGWDAHPLGSASTLARLQQNHNAFEDDFLVLCGDALTDIDVPALMLLHQNSGAEVTIAAQNVPPAETGKYGIIVADSSGRILEFCEKPDPQQARSTLASTGIYVVSPRALIGLDDREGLDIAKHLLPGILARGGKLQVFEQPFSWVDLGCGRDYFDALSLGLKGLLPGLNIACDERQKGLWIAPGADVSARAQLEGPCYVGRDAVIDATAIIVGPSVIGSGAFVAGGSLVQRSVVLPGTRVQTGAWLDEMIACADWAFAHRHADGSPQSHAPMERVTGADMSPLEYGGWRARAGGI